MSGARHVTSHGYVRIGAQYEHILFAERALGKPLPDGAEVHHVNEIKSDNGPGNLVVCPSHAYHELLHKRQLALDAGFPAHFYKCAYCGEFDDLANMFRRKGKLSGWHVACNVAKRLPRVPTGKPSPASVNAAKTHCNRGHLLAGENLISRSAGGRECRECSRIHKRNYKAKKRSAT